MNEHLKDPFFREEWDKVGSDVAALQAKIDMEIDPRVIEELEEDKEDLIAYAVGMAEHRANPVTYTHEEVVRELVQQGWDSVTPDSGWVSEEDAYNRLEAELDALDDEKED